MVFEEDLSDPRASSTSVMFRSLDVSWRRRSRSRSRRRRRCTHPYILPTQPLRYRPNISVRSRISLCPPLASVSHLAISPSPFSSPSLSPILSVRMARTVLEERQGRYVRDRLIRSYGFYHGNAVLSIDRGLILGQNNIVSPSLAYPPRCPLASSHTHTHAQREKEGPLLALQPSRLTDGPTTLAYERQLVRSSGSANTGGGSRYDWLGYNSGRAATLVYRPCHTPSSPSSLTWRSEFPSTVLRVFVAAGNRRISRYASSVNVVPEQVTLLSNLYSSLHALCIYIRIINFADGFTIRSRC